MQDFAGESRARKISTIVLLSPSGSREIGGQMDNHIVLLGDSILDNASYTGTEPDVVSHLRSVLPHGWTATLCAVDGSTTLDLAPQLECIPPAASHLVLSLGGNDAIMNSDLLAMQVRSTAEALALFADRLERFERNYRNALESVVRIGLPLTVCTIYNGNMPPSVQRNARMALAMFNDVIVRAALQFSVNVIELRAVCAEPSDYANPIEPSGSGGAKIARAIAAAVVALDPSAARAVLSAG
jgi:hypothetical protein